MNELSVTVFFNMALWSSVVAQIVLVKSGGFFRGILLPMIVLFLTLTLWVGNRFNINVCLPVTLGVIRIWFVYILIFFIGYLVRKIK